jgi:hypothetical protein
VSIALQRAWATYILKCNIIVGEGFFGLSGFLGFPFLCLFYILLTISGGFGT